VAFVRKRLPYVVITAAVLASLPFLLRKPLPAVLPKADHVIVDKSHRQLHLQLKGKTFATFPIALGKHPQGHKQQQGDSRTPEGNYILDHKNANSGYYRAIHISYPNKNDKASATAQGVDPGGDVMIHGQRNGFGWTGWFVQYFDWTNGCVALTNEEMALVWRSVEAGTPVTITP
jgi:murein L,D-transpeptidase YafK